MNKQIFLTKNARKQLNSPNIHVESYQQGTTNPNPHPQYTLPKIGNTQYNN